MGACREWRLNRVNTAARHQNGYTPGAPATQRGYPCEQGRLGAPRDRTDLQQGRSRITVDLGSAELYRALRIAAIERDCSMREVIVQAIEQWLDREAQPSASIAAAAERAHG